MDADEFEKLFQDLEQKQPDLRKLEASLQEIIAQLMAKKEYLDNLEKTLRDSQEENLEESLKEIERIRIRIIFLIDQAKIYHVRLVSTQGTQSRDESDLENFTALFKEVNLWLTRPKDLVREQVNPNNALEIQIFIQKLEDLLNECRTKLQNLVSITPRVQELTRYKNLTPPPIAQVETLQRELRQAEEHLTGRLQALQVVLDSLDNQSTEPSESEPELAATNLNSKTKPAPIFVPQPVPAVRKEDALVQPDGSFTNVCSRVEETYSSFPSPRSTTESTFKPIEMSDPRSVHTKSSKHKKPPVITTETYDDRHRTRDEKTPDNEYSAEQVSQKVFDFLEIDEPESLSLGDETIDSRASPIPNEEVIDLDSPRFEYYEEIKFKDPVLYGQSQPVEQHEVYETSDLPESSRRRQFVTQTVVDETEKPVTSTTTRKYYVKGVGDPQQVKEYKYVQLFDPNNLDETNRFEVSPYDEEPTTVQIREGTRTVVRTIRRRIIRKVVIINGKETVTEEVVEEPVEENVSEYDRPEITEIEDEGQQEPGKQFYVVSKSVKGVEKSRSETPDSSISRTDEHPGFEVRKVKSVLRAEAKEFTPSYSLSKSTDISLPQDSSISSDTTKPTRFGFMIRDSPLHVSEHSLPEETKPDDKKTSEPTSNVIYISTKEDDKKSVRPQRKKKKKRKGEKDTEEPEKTEDDQKDTESLDSYEDVSDEDLIEKDGKLIKMTKTIVVTKNDFEKEKSPSLSDSSKASKLKQGSKDSVEEIEKMVIVTDDKTRKPHERKDDEKKPKEPTETKIFVGKEKTPVTISSEKPVERKPKDGKASIEREAPEKSIPVEETKEKPKPKSEMVEEKERSPTDKETDKKTKDKKGKPDDIEDKEKPKTEETKPKEQRPDDFKPKDTKEAKSKPDTKKKPEDDKKKHLDDIKVVAKEEDRKPSEKEKLQPLGRTITETSKFDQEPGKKGKPEVFGKGPEEPKQKFFDITQFIEQEQQPIVSEPFTKQKGGDVKDEEPSKRDKPKDEKVKEDKTPEVSFRSIGEVKVEEFKPLEQDKLPSKDPELKVGKPKDIKDKDKRGKTPEKSETEPVDVSKTMEHKTFPAHEHETHTTEKPEQKDETKTTKKHDKGKKEKTPEEDKSKPGTEISETLKFIQFGYRVSPEDERSEVVEPSKVVEKPIEEKDKDEKGKPTQKDKSKPSDITSISEDKKPSTTDAQDKKPKPDERKPKEHKEGEKGLKLPRVFSLDYDLTRPVRLVGRQERTPNKDKAVELGKAQEQPKEGKKPEGDIEMKGKKPDEDKPEELAKSPEQPKEVEKPKDDKEKKKKKEKTPEKLTQMVKAPEKPKLLIEDDETLTVGSHEGTKDKTPDKDKCVVLGKAPEQSTESEKPKERKEGDEKPKQPALPSEDDQSRVSKPKDKGKKEKTPDTDKPAELGEAPEQLKQVEKPKDDKEKKKKKEKTPDKITEMDKAPEKPKDFSKECELLRIETPDKDKLVELGKAPERPTEDEKLKDGTEKKGKKTDKDKPEELVKAPEQFKSQEPSKIVDKEIEEKDKDGKGKPGQKDKSKPSGKVTFDVTSFIEHERPSTTDTEDRKTKPDERKPKDDKKIKEKSLDKDKPVELAKTLEEQKGDRVGKEKPTDKSKPEELDKKSEKTKPCTEKDEPQKVDHLQDDKEKDKKDKASKKDKPMEVDKKTEDLNLPSQDEKLTQFGRPTEKVKKEKISHMVKPVEFGKVPEKPQLGEKPTADKEPKQMIQNKDRTFDVSKKLEEQKLPLEEEVVSKSDRSKDKGKKEKTPEEDKSKPGKEISETLKFIQFGYRVSPEDERSEVPKPTEQKHKDKTPDKNKPVELGRTPEKPTEIGKPKDDTDNKKSPEQQTESKKPTDDGEKKGKKTDKDKPQELAEAPEEPKSQEPSKVVEKPIEEKDKDEKGKPTQKDKSKPSDKITFDITSFIEHEKPSTTDTQDKKPKPDERKQIDDKESKEKPKQPEVLSKMDELLRIERRTGKKEETPDKDKTVELGKAQEQPKEGKKPEGDIEMKGKKTDEDKPKELTKSPEQPKEVEKPKDDKGRKEKTPDKLTQMVKAPEKPKLLIEDDETLTVGSREGTKEKTPDKDKPVELAKTLEEPTEILTNSGKAAEKPKEISKDNEHLRIARLTEGKEKMPDKEKPVELDKTPEQPPTEMVKPGDEKEGKKRRKRKKSDKDKPQELAKASEEPRSQDPSNVGEEPIEEKDKDEKGKPGQEDKSKPLDKVAFDITSFIEHEKPSTRDSLDKVGKPEQEKPKERKEGDEKSKQPELPSEDDQSRVSKPKAKGKKEKTPDTDKPAELGEAPEQLKQVEKPKDDKEKKKKKEKTPDKITEMDKAPEKPKDVSEEGELLRPVRLIGTKEKTPDKDKLVELGKAPEELSESKKAKDDKQKKGRKPDEDKPKELGEEPEQPKGQDPWKTLVTPTDGKEKDGKEKLPQKDSDTFDITKIIEEKKPLTRDTLDKVGKPEPEKLKDEKPKTDEPEDIKDVGKDKSKVVKREVVETIALTGERLPSKDFTEVTKLIEHEKSPVGEQVLFKEHEPADIKKKRKKEKTPDKDKTQSKEEKVWEFTKLIDHEKPQKEEGEPSKVGKPAEDKDTHKTKTDQDSPKGLEKDVFGTMEFIQREKTLPEHRVTFKTETDTFGIVKTQEPEKPSKKEETSKVGKDKYEKAPEKPFDLDKTTETKEQEPSKVSKPKDKERNERTPEGPKLSEQEKLPSTEEEVIEGKPREEKDKEETLVEKSKQFVKEPEKEKLELTKQEPTKVKSNKEEDKTPEQIESLSKDEEPKEGKKKKKGRKKKTPEREEPKSVEVLKPEETDELPAKEQKPSELGKPKDDEDKPAETGKAPKQPKDKDKGKKEKTPEEDKSKPGEEISETLKFIKFGYRVSPEDERSQVVKPIEDKPKEAFKGKSPDKDTTKHTIVKDIDTTESIQEPKDVKRTDKVKVEKEKTQEDKSKPLGKVTEDIKPTDTEETRTEDTSEMVKSEPSTVLKGKDPSQVDKPKEETDKTIKDKTPDDKSKLVGAQPLAAVTSPDEGRIPEKETKEKTPEDKFKDAKTRKDKPADKKEETPEKDKVTPDQPLEEGKPTTIQKGGVDVITFIQHEKSPVSDRQPLIAKDVKEKDKGKRDKPVDKDKTKEPSLEKDITDTTKFIEGEKPVEEGKPIDKEVKDRKEKGDGDKPKTPDTTVEQEPSKPRKPKDVKEKDDRKKEKTPETPKSQDEEKPKDKGRKEKTPEKDKTSDIGKVQEEPKLFPKEDVQKVDKYDKGRTEKTSTDVETIPAADKLPSKQQEPFKLVKEEDKVGKTLDKDKPAEFGKKPEQSKPPSEKVEPLKVGQFQDEEEKEKKETDPKKDKPIQFGKELEQLKWGEKPKDDKEPFDVSKTPEQQKLPSKEELLKDVKPTDREKEKTPEDDKSKPGKVVTATLKFIQQEAYPGQQDEPSEAWKFTQHQPKGISEEKSPAKDTSKHVIVQITEKIKDEHIPSEGQEPSKVDKLTEEKDKDKKGKPTQKDKSKPSEKDTFDVTTFIQHEKPAITDNQDKTSKPEERKRKGDKESKEKPKQLSGLSEDDEIVKVGRLPGRKEKTPDKDKLVELGKAPEQPTGEEKPKDDKEKKGKKTDKDKPQEFAKAPEEPKSQEPSKVVEKPIEEKDKDEKGKPTQKDKSKPLDITSISEDKKPSATGTQDKEPKADERKPKDHKEGEKESKLPRVFSLDYDLTRPVRLVGRQEKTPDKDKPVELSKASEKIKLLPEDDELLKIVKLTGKKDITPDKDKPVELGKTLEQQTEDGQPKDDKDKKGKKPDKIESLKVGQLQDDKEKDKTPEKDEPVEVAKKPEEQKLPSEEEHFKVGKPRRRKEKTPDEEKLKPERGITETLKFIQQETYPSEQGEPSKEPKGVKPSDKDKGPKETTSKIGVDTLETTKLIDHEKPESKKPGSLKFKIVTQDYDEKGEPIKEDKKKPGETPDEYETTKDGRRILVSFKKDEYGDDDSQKKDKKKPEQEKTEADKKKGKAKKGEKHLEEVGKVKEKRVQTPEETEDKQKEMVTGVSKQEDPSQKVSVVTKEPEKSEDKRVREVLIGKDPKLEPDVEKVSENTQESSDSIVRKGERKTPERMKEKPEEAKAKAVKGKKKGKKPKSTTKHDEDLPTEEEEKTPEREVVEKEDQPTDNQTSLTGTIVSITKRFFGLPFGGRKESKPETAKPEEDTKPLSKPDKEDKAPKKKDKKKEQEEDRRESTEHKPSKVVTGKEKKPEPVGREKTVSLGWNVSDEPEDKQLGTSKAILFPDKPSESQPQHGVTPAPVDKKPEADPFGKLVHKPQKPEKLPEPGQTEADGKPSKPSAPTYADLFTQTTPETSPRHTSKVHKTSQTKECQTTEEGIQTDDDRGMFSVHEYRVHVREDEEPSDGQQTTEKYQQTSKPQSPTVTTTTMPTQTSPQVMSPEERDSKKKEKVIRAKLMDKKSGKSKPEDEEDEEFESRKPDEEVVETQMTRPGEEKPEKGRDEPFGVYVKAKVSVTPTDVPSKSKKEDKKERKRKWKGGKGHEDEPTDNIEVTSVVSVDSPKDLIESETQSWRVVPTPQAGISVNVRQGEKFVTDFLEGERAALDTTKDDPKDPKGKKDKKSKKPIKDREDEFRFREGGDKVKGEPTKKEWSPSSESDESRDKDEKYDIDVNVRVAGDKGKGKRTPRSKHRPESEVDINAGITFDPSDERRIRREKGAKPEDDDKYKVSVDVKVKSGETPPKIQGKTADMGTNVPSPETPLEPEDLNMYLEKARTLGKDRSNKMQNMKNNKRGFTWIIPSSRFDQGEPVKTNVKDIDDNVDKLRDAIARRDHILIQRIFVYLIRDIDDWLELIEYRIRLNRGNPNEGPNQEKVNELKYLKDEIDGVGRNVRQLLKTIKDVPSSDKSDILYQLRTYVEQLEPQIKEIQETTEMEKDNAVKDLGRWEEFLNGVNNLSVIVAENRHNLEGVLDSDGSTSSKLEELEKIELANREYMDRALKLIALAKDLANDFPNQEIPPETYTTLETTKMVQSNLDSERDRLLQLLSLADEYEQTLKEFAQVIEVADNLVESPITITSLQHLQDEMQKHRKFFVNLSHCRAILESLERNLDDETRGLYNSLHTKLHTKASSILDKAASRAQQMAMAASKWTILDKGVRNEQQWLQVAHQRLPDLQQVKSADYDQYISLYQSLASDTAMHHAKILQLMDVANNLQDIITCVGLERFYDDYLNVILNLQEEIRMSLEKLIAFQDMWTLYEIMTKKLDAWMKATEKNLKTQKAAPDRTKMRQFWELKAQYEVHNKLKQEMGNNFEKAVQFLPIADEMSQRQILGKREERWKKLEEEIKGIQDSAMATLSAPDAPVNEKLKLLEDELNELNDTVNDLHGIIRTDEELNLYIERLQVLNERLDTIQEELGRLGLLPATESEKVGYLLGLARGLELQLLEELNQSHCLREKLLALEKGLERTKRNQNSVTGMLDQCAAAQSMGSEVVEQAVKTCENVSVDLSDQWQDMMDLRKVLHNLPMKLRLSVSPIGVERKFSQLQEIHTVLEGRCASLLHVLRHRLSLWKKFENQLEKVQQNLEDTDYMVELLTLKGSVDFDRLQTATDRLKDLHDSVAEREDLIRELKELADPLVSSCDPEVASQLNAQVDETVTAWNDTRKNLDHIVDKYKDAVKLWKNYREGRDDIRKWVDQQWGALDILQDKPEEAVQHIKECKETLANQKARLDELKKLVAQIAADIGLDPGSFLECEVEDLGKRLEDVKDTLTTLTSVAESNSQGKDDCKDELVKAKKFLGSVQKSLNVVGEDGNTLSTLRDHLLALTKTESQVQNVKERSIKMNEKPHEIRNETSVVEILELWQQVFQETFQQYYRLSAKLVKSQDGAAALQLWQEYLRHVQTFLAGSLPEDYDGLREAQRLCEVHQNLLTSQQSVLLSRKDDPGVRDFSQALQEQFNSLANLHNETLARIMDRHNEVNKRLKLWDSYRHDQSKLLSWLRDMTRDQSRLQLRYIHLRRLPKLLEQIDMLLSRIPPGKAQIQEQKKQQEDIVKFCDEALATSIKMESVATAERINNIEASLKSWKDFLNRVQDLHKNYESELEKVEKVCDEITNELSSPAPVSFSAIQSRLDLCRDLKRRISELSKNIEEANVTYDQLKECLSPYDMKMLSQRLWLIGQRQGDLEHHLLLQILWLEDRLETQQAFNRRHGRFVNWAEDLIKRFDKNSSADPTNKFLDLETRAKRLETEVEIELNLKNREYNALHAMANNIIDLSKEDAAQEKGKIMPKGQNRIDYEIMKSDVERKIKEVDELWDQLKNLKCARLERKSKLTTTMNDLWKRMEDIKLWLISIEKKLEAPNVIEKTNKKYYEKLLKEHEAIQENIEKQSGNVGEVLNLCELFLGDPAVDMSGIDTNEFESAQQSLEKRWKAVCLSSTERKNRMLGARELLFELSKICKEQESWINHRERVLQDFSSQVNNLKLSDVQNVLDLLEKEKLELDAKSAALKILDASYSKLAQESRLPADNIKQLAGPAKVMISKWHNLNEKWKNLWDKTYRIKKLRDDFIKSQNASIVLLTSISAKLIQAELIPNSKKRLKRVKELEKELEEESGVLRKADEAGLELMKMCPEENNVSATQRMVDEYQIMWRELRDRFDDVKKKSLENVESKEIQVSTLAFEADSEVQVDTLPHMDRLTSRDAYGLELDVALQECNQNLTGLEEILRSLEEEGGANVPTHRALAKIIATCTSSVELAQHLNKILLEDCELSDRDARSVEVNEISDRYQDLVARARERERQLREASERGRLTCPICCGQNWEQLENDLWRLEQWIQYAEAIQRNRPGMPEGIEPLEDMIHAYTEFLIDLDSHKSIIVSLNIVGEHLVDHEEDEEKVRNLSDRLKNLNSRWDNVCIQSNEWKEKLRNGLIENSELYDRMDNIFKWLEDAEPAIRKLEPVDISQDKTTIEEKYKKLKTLGKEVEQFEPQIQSLNEAAIHLLKKDDAVSKRLNTLRLRLIGMRRLIRIYLLRLGTVLGTDSMQALDQTLMNFSQEMLNGAELMSQVPSSTASTDGDGSSSALRRGFRFIGRVLRASIPFQALVVVVFGAIAFVPDEYYNCAFSNNARLQSCYLTGPPPI